MNYQNPYYQNQIMNPYQNYMNMNQNIPQNTNFNQLRGINGKYVNDFSEITANDVPMDIPASVFIKNDGTEIQVRSWNGNGLIESRTYKPILEDKKEDKVNISQLDLKTEYDHFNDVLDDIKASIDNVLSIVKPKTSSRTKKEVDAE